MNRTIKDATVRRFHYENQDQLRQHFADFIAAYNFGRRLKTLKGLTPYEFICKAWASQPERFTLTPLHQMPGINIELRIKPSGDMRTALRFCTLPEGSHMARCAWREPGLTPCLSR